MNSTSLEHHDNTLQDYYATPYVAEIVNTFTNSFFIYLGAKGIYNTLKEGHEKIFLVTFCGYLLVGTGSIFFHMTLKCTDSLFNPIKLLLITSHRSVATGRRAVDDLHNLYHVLRNLQSQANHYVCCHSWNRSATLVHHHNHILPLPPRSDLPPDFLRRPYRRCPAPSNVGHGDQYSTIYFCKRERVERKRQYACDREGRAGETRQARSEDRKRHVDNDFLWPRNLPWWIFYLEPGQHFLLQLDQLEKRDWPSMGGFP